MINPKKVAEFMKEMESPKVKVALLNGPSGSGKNSLIKIFAEEHKY